MNKSLKKAKKILSIIIVIFLLSTVFSQTVLSKGFLSELKEKTQDAIENIKEKITNNANEEKTEENTNPPIIQKIKTNPLITSLLTYSALKSSSSQSNNFVIYAKYKNNEKEATTRFGVPTLIDINNDGTNDIKAKIVLRLGIEKPLALSLNFKLEIQRLSGIDEINEHLEVYAQLTFPGVLNSDMQNDRVRFGYISEKYKEIPSICTVTYKYIPYIFYKEKPSHSASLNPGSITDKDALTLVFSYADFKDGAYVSEDIFEIKNSPAVHSELFVDGIKGAFGKSVKLDLSKSTTSVITYERHANNSVFRAGLVMYKQSSFKFDIELTPFKKGGGRIEYQREPGTLLDALLFFEPEDEVGSNYFYVYDLPSHIKLSWFPGDGNLIELNSFDERCGELGWRNALIDSDVTARVYLRNLPSFISFNWNGELKDGELDLISDISGVSAHVYAVDIAGTGGSLTADLYSGENFDFSIYWSFSEKLFGISRSNIDLSVRVSLFNVMGSGESANFSCDIENVITSPFEFSFATLLDGKVEVNFAGNDFEIKNLDLDVFAPGVGKVILKMYSFKMSRQSSVYFGFSYDKVDEEVTISCEISVSNGVEIRGLVIGFNDFLLPVNDIITTGTYHHVYSLTFSPGVVKYSFSSDLSSGWVCISGGLILTFDSTFEKLGQVIGGISGVVAFNNENDELNISWSPDGVKVDGSGVVSLGGFSFWFKDKFDISISSIVGSFVIDTYQGTGEIKLNVGTSTASFSTDFSIDIKNLMNVTVKGDFNLDFTLGLSGYVKLSWDEEGLKLSSGGVSVGFNGVFSVSNLYFNYMDDIIVSSSSIKINGDFVVSLDIAPVVSFNSQKGASVTIKGIDLQMSGFSFSCTRIYFGASGSLYVNVPGDYIYVDVNAAVSILNAYVSGVSISFSTTASLKGFYIRGLFGTIGGNTNLRIDKVGGSAVKIDNFYLSISSPYVLVLWDRLHISGSGMIELSDEIKIAASLTGVEFTGFKFSTNLKEMNIDGNVNLVYAGVLTIKGSVGSTVSVNVILDSGSLNVYDLGIGVSGSGSSVSVSFDSLNLKAYVDFSIMGSKSTGFNIVASGKGSLEINNAAATSPGTFDVSLGYFKLNLHNLKGSVLGLEIDNNFNVYSASASGSISQINLQDLSVSAYNTFIEDVFLLIVAELTMTFEGSGDISFELSEPDVNNVQSLNINGAITGNGKIVIENLKSFVNLLGMYIEMDYFTIQDSTTFYLNAEGLLNHGSAEEKLQHLNVKAGCDSSTWTINRLFISSLIEIFNLNSNGAGDISFSGIIPSDIGDPAGDFLISVSGNSWSWSELKLFGYPDWPEDWDFDDGPPGIIAGIPIGPGSFEGDITLHIGLDLFMSLLFADKTVPLSSGLAIIANSNSKITFNEIFGSTNIELNKGEFTITYDMSKENFSVQIQDDTIFIPKIMNIDIESSMPISIAFLSLAIPVLQKTNYRLNLHSAQLYPGKLSLSWDADDITHVRSIKLESSSSIKPTFGFELKHVESGIALISAIDLVFTAPYLEFAWDIDSKQDYKEGELNIDTQGKQISGTLFVFDLFYISGGFSADEFYVKWNFSKWWTKPFKIINTGGDITFYVNCGIAFKFDGEWYTLMGTANIDELSAQLLPQGPYTQGDNFKVYVSASGSAVQGATVKYEKKTQAGWTHVSTKTTGSNGQTSDFTAQYTDVSGDNGRVIISYSGYSDKTITFKVLGGGFTANAGGPYYAQPGSNIQFTGSATGGTTPYYYSWNFGDGSTGTGATPTHTYATAGTYTVTLTVTDNTGSTASDTTQAIISTNNQPPYLHDPAITGPSVGRNNANIKFTAHATDPDGDPIEYQWQKSTPSGIPLTTGWLGNTWDPTWNVQNTPADHWVRVKVRDNQGHQTDWSVKKYVTIANPPVAKAEVPPWGEVGQQIEFDGSDSDDPNNSNGYIVSWEWNFGDGNTGTGEITFHTYQNTDVQYTVKLTVTNNYGLTDTAESHIQITASGEWIKPTGHNDPDDFWNDETKAYDGNINTAAESNRYYGLQWQWCSPLEFTIPQNTFSQVKFNAFYHSNWCKEIKIESYSNGMWFTMYQGSYEDQKWQTEIFSRRSISKFRVQFYMKGYPIAGTSAEIFEIELYKTSWT